MKKAYFIDLDNTIYFTKPNVDVLLGPLYAFLEKEDLGINKADFERAKQEMLRIPFQKVANKYNFNAQATENAIGFLKERELTQPMDVHNEYHYIKTLQGLKIVVTAGFQKTQSTKLDMLGITADFDELFVVDNTKMPGTKKDAFLVLMRKYKLSPTDILVIGDDADSEIKFGLELGIETFLFDPDHNFPEAKTTYRSTTLKDLVTI